MFANHVALHDETVQFAMALVAFILAAITLFQSRWSSLLSWAVVVIAAALVIVWWPT